MRSIDRTGLRQDLTRTYLQITQARRFAASAGRQPPRAIDARAPATAREVVQKAFDLRAHLRTHIKQQVEDGTYQVPARLLARKMLDQS